MRMTPLGRMLTSMMDEFSHDCTCDCCSDGPVLGYRCASHMIDIKDMGNKMAIYIDLPGMKKEDINLDLTNRHLQISTKTSSEFHKQEQSGRISQKRFSNFSKRITLPVEVIPQKARAEYQQGVLKIEVPKLGGGKSHKLKIH